MRPVRFVTVTVAAAGAAVLLAATSGAALARPLAGWEPDGQPYVQPHVPSQQHAPAPTPDAPAPARRAVADSLVCQALGGLDLCTHGDDAHLAEAAAAGQGGDSASSGSSTRIGCYSSGPRVQAVYARPATSQDGFAAALPSFQRWAGAVDKAVDDSARKTGGSRHVRFVSAPSGSGCTLSVLRLALPAEAFRSFAATVEALQDVGLDDQDVKYLVWADAGELCGMASTYLDDSPGQGNLNNGRYPMYARIDRPCWGHAETHELMHMLGAVQRGAPHATEGLHCSDGRDVMCYDDGSRGSRQVSACDAAHSRLLDCRNDTYFAAAPAPQSWLSGHWNTASSAFLAPGWTDPPPPASPKPAPTTSPAPRTSPTPRPQPSASTGPAGGLVPDQLLPLPVPTLTLP